MRSLELLKALSKKELKLIEKRVAGGKRKSLFPLFKELKKCLAKDALPVRSELFKKTFGKPYLKNKDYLLRNELRLLNDIIYDFLITDCLQQHLVKNKSLYNRWLAQSFYEREMPAFAEDITSFLNLAKKNIELDEASAMFALRSAWDSMYPDNKKIPLEHVKEWKYEEQRRFLHRLRRIEFSEHFFEKFARLSVKIFPPADTDDWSIPGATTVDFSAIDREDWYTRYLNLQARYAQSRGEAQLNYLTEMIKIMDTAQAQLVIKAENRFKAIAAMAIHLSTNKQHDQAAVYMEKAVALSKKNQVRFTPQLILNYMINLIARNLYKQAIDLYHEYMNLLNVSANRGQGIILAAYACLFMAKPDDALEMISQKFELEPIEALNPRYIYIISFILRKQYDLARAELRNLKRMLTQTGSPFHEQELNVAAHFQTYLNILLNNKTSGAKLLEKLKAQAQATLAIFPVNFTSEHLEWLIKQL